MSSCYAIAASKTSVSNGVAGAIGSLVLSISSVLFGWSVYSVFSGPVWAVVQSDGSNGKCPLLVGRLGLVAMAASSAYVAVRSAASRA